MIPLKNEDVKIIDLWSWCVDYLWLKKVKNLEILKKNNTKKQKEVFDDLAKNYAQTIESGKQFGKESLEKIK